MSRLRTGVLLAATVLMGLAAGLFQTFSYAVMPGLRETDDAVFVAAMQRINVAIVNPWFLTIFLGAFAATAVAVVLELRRPRGPAAAWLIAALLLYVATLAITRGVNIPLNDALEAAGDRARFEDRWTRWNVVRSVTSTAAFGCLAWASVLHHRRRADARS